MFNYTYTARFVSIKSEECTAPFIIHSQPEDSSPDVFGVQKV
jgi:hypothetical protein